MELNKGMKIGIGVTVALVSGFAIYKLILSKKGAVVTDSNTKKSDTKKSDTTVSKYEGKNITNGIEIVKVENGKRRWYDGDKWNALTTAKKNALVTVTAAEFNAIPKGVDM